MIFQRRGLFEFVHRQPPWFGLEITKVGWQGFLQKFSIKTCDCPGEDVKKVDKAYVITYNHISKIH